jgi:DNA-binding MurR/RpiR family transcriptional regulator
MRNIEETARMNPPETVEAAIAKLDRAERVFCLAQGISVLAADYLTHQLALLGINAQRAPRSGVEAALLFPGVTSRDVVVVFSVWRYLEETVSLCKAVRQAGCGVIGLVDNKAAPIVTLSDLYLVAGTVTPKLGHSITALMTIVNVLATGVAIANPERALARLSQIEDYYSRINLIARNSRD